MRNEMRRYWIGIIVILGLIPCYCKGQNIDSIAFVLDSAYSKSPFFANVLISKNDKIVFEKSYGFADESRKVKLTNKNSFQVASISKQFTAYAIMMLKSKGKLNYDMPVVNFIVEFPYKEITIRQLMQHTSGLPNFWNNIRPQLDTMKVNGNKELMEYLINHPLPLQFKSGSKFNYADIGYDILALIIERVSGIDYETYLYENIFKPLKMKNTHAYLITDISRINNKHLAIGHVQKNNEWSYAHLNPSFHFVYYLGNFYGDGSVVTTARDLLKWDYALKHNQLLPDSIQLEMTTPATYNGEIVYANKDQNVSYGFGWFLKSNSNNKMIYHSGGHPGNIHYIYKLVNKDITFVFLSNTEVSTMKTIRNRIIQILEK